MELDRTKHCFLASWHTWAGIYVIEAKPPDQGLITCALMLHGLTAVDLRSFGQRLAYEQAKRKCS